MFNSKLVRIPLALAASASLVVQTILLTFVLTIYVPSVQAAITNCTNTSVGNGITCVQAAEGEQTGSVTSVAVAYGSSVTAGHLLVASCSIGSNIQTAVTFKDNVNSANWTQVYGVLDATNNRALYQFYLPNTLSGTITGTLSWTTSVAEDGCSVQEYSGIATTSPQDQMAAQCLTGTVTAGNSTSGNTPNTTQAVELLVGNLRISSSATTTVSSLNLSFVAVSSDTYGTASHSHTYMANETVAATGAYAFNPTLSASVTGMCAGIATYKAAAAAASCSGTRLALTGVGC